MSSKDNSRVTLHHNAILGRVRKQRDFIKRAVEINLKGQPFTYADFPEYSRVAFRQMILRLKKKGIVELVYKSPNGFYRVSWISLSRKEPNITLKPTGVDKSIVALLQTLEGKPKAVHDLKFQFPADELHEILKSKGYQINPKNGCILLNIPLETDVTAKVLIYPKKVQVNIACSYKPIIQDIFGVIKETEFLARVNQHLLDITDNKANIPSFREWIIVQYHLGIDGSEENSDTRFHYTWGDVGGGLVRLYTKEMRDGKKIVRLEQIQSPHITVEGEIKNILGEETTQKDILVGAKCCHIFPTKSHKSSQG